MENNQLAIQTGAGSVGFVEKMITAVQSFEAARELGEFIISSGYAPKHFDKPEAVVLAIDAGKKLGLDWFQSLQESFIVNGIPGYKGKILKALVQASSVCEKWETEFFGSLEKETRGVRITYKRKGQNQQVREYTTDMAKMAKLWGKKKKYDKDRKTWVEYDDSWVKHPEDMLEWKAVSRVLNDFSDITKGFRPVEDLMDYTPENEIQTTVDGINIQTQTSTTTASAMIAAAEQQVTEAQPAEPPKKVTKAAPKKAEPQPKEEKLEPVIEDVEFEEIKPKPLEEVRAMEPKDAYDYINGVIGFDMQTRLFNSNREKKTKRILIELYTAFLAGQVETYIKANFELETSEEKQIPLIETGNEWPKLPDSGKRDFGDAMTIADAFIEKGIQEGDIIDALQSNGLEFDSVEDFYKRATAEVLDMIYNA